MPRLWVLGFRGFSVPSPNEAIGKIPTLCVLGRRNRSEDLRVSLEKIELRLESPKKLTEKENGPRLWALGRRFLSGLSPFGTLICGVFDVGGGTRLCLLGNSLC